MMREDGLVAVTLLVPMKPPRAGKSRLRGAFGVAPHTSLVLALASDTVSAAVAAPGVDRVVVVTGDVEALATLGDLGADVVDDEGAEDLNAALLVAERRLFGPSRAGDAVVGALQADLPALRPADLGRALAEAGGRRAFTADRHGTGTTLLLSAPGGPLAPRFGVGSAAAHAASGALALTTSAPSLRSDVDTADDLAYARELGLGTHTAELLTQACAVP